jgi:hypothetical protein
MPIELGDNGIVNSKTGKFEGTRNMYKDDDLVARFKLGGPARVQPRAVSSNSELRFVTETARELKMLACEHFHAPLV